ncbi:MULTISPECIES: heme exporter protein CcmD [Psychrobacter]|uniref:Heme exporter protein D n=1 Tax=Psychrobacter alimentarius TaxID=261164 RepID=A0ABM6A0Q5_9GAMM|nr:MULTISPECIES: heme exporter protein CcmD [Psychrobacter]AMT97926.1 cytochrome C biogenesis protein CcmD [Psychrobacter alimentarius]QCB29798.1 heme exporter protein CcmD [Psychrobacter sp. PAMC27889]
MQPYFYSVSEFIAMGKHGVFVWSCWAITIGVILVFIIYSRRQRQALIKQLTIQQARQAQRTAKVPTTVTKASLESNK